MKRKPIPQYDLPGTEDAFNLRGEVLRQAPQPVPVHFPDPVTEPVLIQGPASPRRRPHEARGSAASNACFGAL